MATSRTFAIATSVICLLGLFQNVNGTQITNSKVSSLLSLLNRKISGNKKPVIIILEKDSGHSLQNKLDQLTSSEEHDPINIPHFLHEKVNNQIIKKSTPSYLNLLQQGQKDRQRYGPQRSRAVEDNGKEVDKRVLRSSIVKKLLRISNSIQCDAKDNCENKCQSKYRGKKTYQCQVQCKVKYECEEPKAEEEPCESGCEDSCGKSNECTMMSTKGEIHFSEEDKCKRC